MRLFADNLFTRSSALALLTGLTLCTAGVLMPSSSPAADEHGDHHEDAVRLDAAQMKEFGVEVATAGGARIVTYVELPGEVLPNADRVAHIVPRYAGVVKEARKRVGDRVETGDVLAVIESSESLTDYELKTLLEGTVIAKHVTRGEAVTVDTQAFVIADLRDVWVELSVYQRDLARVNVGQHVLVSAGHHLPDLDGTISYVSPVLDEDTRTARARIVMDNGDGSWRPGMFVAGRVAVNAVDVAVAVPLSALQTVEARNVVFVQDEDGFEAREVTLGRASTTHAEIVSGLSVGESYVAKGGFIIKAELGKSELGDGHGH
jgi:cobalt-zinc-cadmium efflux system membrane fusion protein